ncbi:MAG: hypothetical protein J6U18_01890 [Acetobacter sp.]|nr:hypothetical protein [Acetobacter sp.]
MTQNDYSCKIFFSEATLEHGLSLVELERWQLKGFTRSEIVAAFLGQQEVFEKTRWKKKRTPQTEGKSISEYLIDLQKRHYAAALKVHDILTSLPINAAERTAIEHLLKRALNLYDRGSVEALEAKHDKHHEQIKKAIKEIVYCAQTGDLTRLQETSLSAILLINNPDQKAEPWTFNMIARGLNFPMQTWIAQHSRFPSVTALLWGFFLDNMETDNFVPFTQKEIADITGFSKHDISHAARDLEEVGAIRIERFSGRPFYFVNDKIVKFNSKAHAKTKVTPEKAGLHFERVQKKRKTSKTRKYPSPQESKIPLQKHHIPISLRQLVTPPPPPHKGAENSQFCRISSAAERQNLNISGS